MVLESIIGERNIREKPYLIGIITFVIAIGSIIAVFSNELFLKYASLLSVAFITIGLVPIIHNIMAKEEYEEVMARKSATTFFARHFNLIMIYVWVFIGIILAFAVVYVVVPVDVKQTLFSEQISAFCNITGSSNCVGSVPNSISGHLSGAVFNSCKNPATREVGACAVNIFETNGIVLLFIVILSLLYGAGAIFIIAWNGSILGILFGEFFSSGNHVGWIGFLQSMIIGHGPPELFSYIFGALAGTILSAMISRGHFLKHEVSIITKDVAFLFFLALFSVLYGAIIEAILILGYADLYFVLGFVYVIAVIILVVFYGRKKFTIVPLDQ